MSSKPPESRVSIDGAEHGRARCNGVELHYVAMGQGPLVVLLHGYPEFWYSWRHQIPALAAAGYRVVAPDLRGYNESDKPPRVRDYAVRVLIDDVEALIEAMGETRAAMIVGHDWGGAVAWTFAEQKPERLAKLAILNMPHVERFMRGLWSPRQFRKSWYTAFFQLPLLPERSTRAGDAARLRGTMRRDLLPGRWTEDDLQAYADAYMKPGVARSAINYYRAGLRYGFPKHRPVEVPVLVLWGQRDAYLGEEWAQPRPDLVPDCVVYRLPNASHWVQIDEPEAVNAHLLSFLE